METTKLLIPEHPLQVLPSLACKIGLNEAMVLQQLHYWLQNIASSNDKEYQERHFFKGTYWRYGTYKAWKKQDFPFWSEVTIKRAISSLEKQGLVRSDNFNEKKFDRTKWYTINYEAIPDVDLPVNRASYQNDPTMSSNCTDDELKLTRWQTPPKPTPAVAPTLVGPGPETTTETTTETTNTPISDEIGAQTEFLKQAGQTENPTLPVKSSVQVEDTEELHYVRMVVKHFNTLHEQYPDKISQDVTVPRKIESLSTRKYSAVRQWYATGKSPEEVCDALSVWVTQLKTTVGGINFFAQKPFPLRKSSKEEVAKEYDATKRLIEKLK